MEDFLEAGTKRYPVISTERHPSTLPYSFARSEESWRSWNLGRRKATEVCSNPPPLPPLPRAVFAACQEGFAESNNPLTHYLPFLPPSQWQRAGLIHRTLKEKWKPTVSKKSIMVWARDRENIPQVLYLSISWLYAKYPNN